MNVLIIGARKRVLKRLSAALEKAGIGASWTNNYRNSSIIPESFDPQAFDVVALGRALKPGERAELQAGFERQNPDIRFVEGLAPITELLIAQIRLAAGRAHEPVADIRISGRQLSLNNREKCHLTLTLYRLNLLYRARKEVLLDATLEAGARIIPLPAGKHYWVLSQNGSVVATGQYH